MTADEYYKITVQCPKCGGTMSYTGGMLGWECDKCEFEAEIEYDETNKEYYPVDDDELSYEEIMEDPENNIPKCCIGCNSAFPECMKNCDIFDD